MSFSGSVCHVALSPGQQQPLLCGRTFKPLTPALFRDRVDALIGSQAEFEIKLNNDTVMFLHSV